MRTTTGRSVALIITALLALVLLAFGARPAAAAAITGDVEGLAVGSIDPSAHYSLTVIRTAPNPFDDPSVHAGEAAAAGIEVTIRRVNGIDLTTAAGWNAARDLEASTVADLGPARTAITDDRGRARFDDIAIGVYLVVETPARGTRPAPFLVTVPSGDVEKPRWIRAVEVYAKDAPPDAPEPPPSTPPNPVPPEPVEPPKLGVTGAQITGAALGAAALLVCGFALLAYRRRKEGR